MRRLLWGMLVGSAVTLATGRAEAQVVVGGPANPLRMNMMNDWFAAPGNYGMSYGVPSYGLARSYSAFSSPYGPGYAYGYPPSGILPGPYGVGLWRPGFISPGYVYGASYYQTFALPGASGPLPPVGAYAPGLGPPSW